MVVEESGAVSTPHNPWPPLCVSQPVSFQLYVILERLAGDPSTMTGTSQASRQLTEHRQTLGGAKSDHRACRPMWNAGDLLGGLGSNNYRHLVVTTHSSSVTGNSVSEQWCSQPMKPISQLRFDCDTTTTRLRRKICSRRIASNGSRRVRYVVVGS